MKLEPKKIRFLRWVLRWVLNKLSFEMHFVVLPKELVQSAKNTTGWAKKRYPDFGGEALRHYCYADLQDRFPQYSKREISKAIEVVL